MMIMIKKIKKMNNKRYLTCILARSRRLFIKFLILPGALSGAYLEPPPLTYREGYLNTKYSFPPLYLPLLEKDACTYARPKLFY